MSAITCAHIYVSGRVQGVFYRAFTEETASALGLGGWCRNLRDGRVEAVLEGPRKSIDEAIKRLYQGPPASRVDDIEISWEPPRGEVSFGIKHGRD